MRTGRMSIGRRRAPYASQLRRLVVAAHTRIATPPAISHDPVITITSHPDRCQTPAAIRSAPKLSMDRAEMTSQNTGAAMTTSMGHVIHDPRTDWCACEPGSMSRCDYRMLADVVIEELNPSDGEDAEVSICIDAVRYVAAYVRSLPCQCASGDGEMPCARCQVLGTREQP